MMGMIFNVDGRGGNAIEVMMTSEYAKRFADDLREAVHKLEGKQEYVMFNLVGTPVADKDVMLSEIQDGNKKIMVH